MMILGDSVGWQVGKLVGWWTGNYREFCIQSRLIPMQLVLLLPVVARAKTAIIVVGDDPSWPGERSDLLWSY